MGGTCLTYGCCLKTCTVVACIYVLLLQGIGDIADNIQKFMDPEELPPGVGPPIQITGTFLAIVLVVLASAGLVSVVRQDPQLARLFYLGYVVAGGLNLVLGAITLTCIQNSGDPKARNTVKELLPIVFGFFYPTTFLVMACAKLHSDALQGMSTTETSATLLAE
ncbi:unnamed protein product [Prorocentrum cordatum]|uniref:Uncharacterized protein n=1 Tax=Prorocentrum cordatum TaxID=2364126 RepID=A0ABN9XE18_9DINO|nr:unnamed protein product [Polarella glacialis]